MRCLYVWLVCNLWEGVWDWGGLCGIYGSYWDSVRLVCCGVFGFCLFDFLDC